MTAVQVARSVETPAASSDATTGLAEIAVLSTSARRSIIVAAPQPDLSLPRRGATVVTETPSFETRRPRVTIRPSVMRGPAARESARPDA